MPQKVSASEAAYFLGFDGGGTKTDCVLSDSEGRVLARAAGGPSNPVRTSYMKAWFSSARPPTPFLAATKLIPVIFEAYARALAGQGALALPAARKHSLNAVTQTRQFWSPPIWKSLSRRLSAPVKESSFSQGRVPRPSDATPAANSARRWTWPVVQ